MSFGNKIGEGQFMLYILAATLCLFVVGGILLVASDAIWRSVKGSSTNETGQVLQAGGGLIKRFLRFFSRIYHV